VRDHHAVIAFGIVAVSAGVVASEMSRIGVHQGYAPEQPIAFLNRSETRRHRRGGVLAMLEDFDDVLHMIGRIGGDDKALAGPNRWIRSAGKCVGG